MREIKPNRLQRHVSHVLILFASILFFTSMFYFLVTVFFTSAHWSWVSDTWPPVLAIGRLLILLLARGFFKPLKRLDKMDTRIRQIIDNMSEGLQIVSNDFRYLYVNKAVAEQGKTTQDALIGKTMMQVYPDIEKSSFFPHLQRCMEDQKEVTMRSKFTFKDGTVGWFQLLMQPVPEGVMILSIDVTGHAKALKELMDLNIQLEQEIKQKRTPASSSKKKSKSNTSRRSSKRKTK